MLNRDRGRLKPLANGGVVEAVVDDFPPHRSSRPKAPRRFEDRVGVFRDEEISRGSALLKTTDDGSSSHSAQLGSSGIDGVVNSQHSASR